MFDGLVVFFLEGRGGKEREEEGILHDWVLDACPNKQWMRE